MTYALKYNKYIFSLCICLLSIFVFADSSPAELLEQARLLSKQEKYKEAVQVYETILDTGYFSESVYYNLGTVYVRDNNVAPAILYLRKSLKMNPNNPDIQQNLKIARSMVQTEIIPIPEFFITRYWSQFSRLLSSTAWAVIGLLSAFSLLVCFYFWLIGEVIERKKKAFYIGIVALFIFLLSIIAGWTALSHENSTSQAVVNQAESLRVGADERSEEIMTLSPGVEVEILDEIGDYYKVKLFDQETGWIMKDKLGII